MPTGTTQVSQGLPQVSKGGSKPAGGVDLQGQIRGGQVLFPQHCQDPEGSSSSGPNQISVTRRLEESEGTYPLFYFLCPVCKNLKLKGLLWV